MRSAATPSEPARTPHPAVCKRAIYSTASSEPRAKQLHTATWLPFIAREWRASAWAVWWVPFGRFLVQLQMGASAFPGTPKMKVLLLASLKTHPTWGNIKRHAQIEIQLQAMSIHDRRLSECSSAWAKLTPPRGDPPRGDPEKKAYGPACFSNETHTPQLEGF